MTNYQRTPQRLPVANAHLIDRYERTLEFVRELWGGCPIIEVLGALELVKYALTRDLN